MRRVDNSTPGEREQGNIGYDAVRETVRRWPPQLRAALIHELIDTFAQSDAGGSAQRRTLDKALGLLRTEHPAPSDEEAQTWLQERRLEKYS